MNIGEEGVNTSSSETESVPGVIPKDGFEVPQSVGITRDENTVTGGDGLDISPNGEIQTPEKGLVPDVNEDNLQGINKNNKTVNTSSSETGSVPGVIPWDGKEVPQSVVITHDENTCGDGLNVSSNGEKDLHTHEKADANKDNHDESNKGREGANTFSSEVESVCGDICQDGSKVPPSVKITHDENTVTIGDNLDIFPNGEKDIHTPKKGLVLDVNEDNHDRINKGEEKVNASSPETESVQGVIPKDGCEVPQSVSHDENSSHDDLDSSINTEKDIHTCEKGTINEHNRDRLNNGEKEVNGQKTETLKEVICKDGNEVSD